MKASEIQFKSGSFTLSGTLHLPETANPPLVVGSHGLEGSQNSGKQQVLARLLPANGIAFFRFDHRGCGRSEGRFITDTSLEKRSQDLIAAVAHITALGLTCDRLALFGSSIGGATCIHAFSRLEGKGYPVAGAVLCASPVNSSTIVNIPTQANDQRPSLPLSFFTENLLFDLTEASSALHHVLIFHGDADEVVPVENARRLYEKVREPKELVIQKGCGHQMTAFKDQEEFERRARHFYTNLLNA